MQGFQIFGPFLRKTGFQKSIFFRENNTYTYTTENDPGLLYRSYVLSTIEHSISMTNFYEQIVYNTINPDLFDMTKLISVLELDFYLTTDIVIILPNLDIIPELLVHEKHMKFIEKDQEVIG